jgi:aminoglycoside phosphotransferase (APT) family kinase protein
MNCEQQSNLVLKVYVRDLEPVLKANASDISFLRLSCTCPQLYYVNTETCVKEFQVLRGLARVGFPVPKAYICECDSNVLGNPFVIMQKEEQIQNGVDNIEWFAKNLACLHNLDPTKLGIDALKVPEDTNAFARRCLLYFKILLNRSSRHSKALKKDFEFAIRWLESNVPNTGCPKYCLLHGDYRLRINTILTKDSRRVLLDWETAEIGDPAYDVGYAYARIRAELGEKTADRFVKEYMRHFDGNLAERLFFYKLAGHLRSAILHSSIMSNPLMAYEIRGKKAFLLFPFLHSPFFAKIAGTDRDIILMKCFEEFVGENLSQEL